MYLYGDVLKGCGLWRRRMSVNRWWFVYGIYKKMCYGVRWIDWINLFNI